MKRRESLKTPLLVSGALGALSVGVDQFLQKLLDKCYDAKTQQIILPCLYSSP